MLHSALEMVGSSGLTIGSVAGSLRTGGWYSKFESGQGWGDKQKNPFSFPYTGPKETKCGSLPFPSAWVTVKGFFPMFGKHPARIMHALSPELTLTHSNMWVCFSMCSMSSSFCSQSMDFHATCQCFSTRGSTKAAYVDHTVVNCPPERINLKRSRKHAFSSQKIRFGCPKFTVWNVVICSGLPRVSPRWRDAAIGTGNAFLALDHCQKC